jgi:ribosomal protein L33
MVPHFTESFRMLSAPTVATYQAHVLHKRLYRRLVKISLFQAIDSPPPFWYLQTTMSQDRLIKLVSEGDEKGVGKGHVIYTTKNRKKLADRKFAFKKFNPVARKHTLYKEKK